MAAKFQKQLNTRPWVVCAIGAHLNGAKLQYRTEPGDRGGAVSGIKHHFFSNSEQPLKFLSSAVLHTLLGKVRFICLAVTLTSQALIL